MILKNISGGPVTFAGHTIAAGDQFDFSEADVAGGIPAGLSLIGHDPIFLDVTQPTGGGLPRGSIVPPTRTSTLRR
jgi:hypothetical protein